MGKLALDERSLGVEPRHFGNSLAKRYLLFNEFGQILQNFLIACRPLARYRVDGAQRSKDVPVVIDKGNT
jgi:hypothetical protein